MPQIPRFIPACAGNVITEARVWVYQTVHPRVCGKRHAAMTTKSAQNGSSPRVRETCYCIQTEAVGCSVHPRVCGKRETFCDNACNNAGSSPRVRETCGWQWYCNWNSRFIPACAGNVVSVVGVSVRKPVHPRVCGKRRRNRIACLERVGSSPRVRETSRDIVTVFAVTRFIPACAGNVVQVHKLNRESAVHPRVCGKRLPIFLISSNVFGSSPRVRETLSELKITKDIERFIPACAGNVNVASPPKIPSSVHPRVCGKRSVIDEAAMVKNGSSPRVRETFFSVLFSVKMLRFIPACAGNVPLHNPRGFCPTVHPRVCGKRRASRILLMPAFGSSPRVRET